MKIILPFLSLIFLLYSCNKEEQVEENSSYEYNPWSYSESNYYFKGIIKDTTNKNSLVNHYYYPETCISGALTDTIKDSTYFYHYRTISSKFPCNPIPRIKLKNQNDSVVLIYYLPNNLKKLNDTVTANIYF